MPAAESWCVIEPTSGPCRCVTCNVDFADAEGLRSHTKLPWHIYNVKRKVAGLAPVGEDDYLARRERSEVGVEAPKKGDSHLKKRKSRDKARDSRLRRKSRSLSPVMRPDEDICLFDTAGFNSVSANLAYMAKEYSFFLPPGAVDVRGLLRFLHQKLRTDSCCLACDMAFSDLAACRNHMIDKGHTRLGDEVLSAAKSFITPVLEVPSDWQVVQPAAPSVQMAPSGLLLPGGRVATSREFAWVYQQHVNGIPPAAEKVTGAAPAIADRSTTVLARPGKALRNKGHSAGR
jgi:pre-60S factor REI1